MELSRIANKKYSSNSKITRIRSNKVFIGAPRRTRTLHNGSEDHCDIHFTMGAFG